MILVWLSQLLGWLVAHAPEAWVERAAKLLGWLLYRLPLARVRVARSNIHHAFPEKDDAWRARVGLAACQRLVEMTLFALAAPFLSAKRVSNMISFAPDDRERFREAYASGRGGVTLLPHTTLFELMAAISTVAPEARGHGSVFRPLAQPALSDWVKRTRERWGLVMLSRREGMSAINQQLRQGKVVGMLFDQHVGKRGQLIFFLERIATATHLPGLLCKRFRVPAFLLVPRRTGFWRVRVSFAPLPPPTTPSDLAVSGHRGLAAYLRESEGTAADWLWFHGRWKTLEHRDRRFRLLEENNYLRESIGDGQFPRRTRLWVRMPNWLGDSIMAIPLLRALRQGRPDAEITLLAPANQLPLLEEAAVADVLRPLPKKATTLAYFRFFRGLRQAYPDTYLTLTNSWRSDLEAWLTGAPQRFGMRRPGKPRPLLTEPWPVPREVDETREHQLAVWERMLRFYGLAEPLDRAPLPRAAPLPGRVGLICGTENTPAKRWPMERWRELIEQLLARPPALSLVLFGTAKDAVITAEVAHGFPPDQLVDLAGQTDLRALMAEMRRCQAIACNDTGGMHLANLLGVPVVAIFGPTNPVRTGPVFSAPACLLQPPDCPPIGGAAIELVTAEEVGQALRPLLSLEHGAPE